MAIEDVLARTFYINMSDLQEAALESAVRQIYATSVGSAMIDSYLGEGSSFRAIRFGFAPDEALAARGLGLVIIDPAYPAKIAYINKAGVAVSHNIVTVVAHELVHALEGLTDDWERTDDFAGPTVTFANRIYAELGIDQQKSYPGQSLLNESLVRGEDYSLGNPFDRAWSEGTYFTADGDARDLLVGRNAENSLYGGRGNDIVHGGTADDNLHGDDDDDRIFGREGADLLYGGDGNDTIHGGDGNDAVYGGNDNDTIFGEDGDDFLAASGGDNVIYGGMGEDKLNTSNGNDTLYGDDDDDEIFAGGGDDILYGGDGEDRLFGGFDDDTLYGGADTDVLNGDEGDDEIFGGAGIDFINGGIGNDVIDGGDEIDNLDGGSGDDTLNGGAGGDRIEGGQGNDRFLGGEGADQLTDVQGDDSYFTGNGDAITDADGDGEVFLDGLLLEGTTRVHDQPSPHDCIDPNSRPNNEEDEDKYVGDAGEIYMRISTGLMVTYGGSSITINGWTNGHLGITLDDEYPDPEDWTPPDCFRSPLVFDLDGDGIEITALAASNAYFDIDNDGDAERTAWVSADDGILAIDLNGDGRIFGGGELFGYGGTFSGANGNASTLPGFEDGGRLVGPGGLDTVFESGFDKLAALDFNRDGVIDATDTFYNSLVVWRDLDGDGTSDDGELFGLAESGIASISLTSIAGDRIVADSLITDTGSYVASDGSVGEVSDVWFRFNQFDTIYDDSNVTAAIAALPQIRGTGALPDLHVAMADDPTLLAMVTDLAALGGDDLATYRAAVQDILFRWAGVENADTFGRGASADGRKLAFVETLADTPFRQWSGPDPRSQAGQVLDLQFETVLRDMMVRFAGQTSFGDAVIPQISFNNGAFVDLLDGTTSTQMLDTIFDSAPTEWADRFAHVQAGVMMLDRVYLSFADVQAAGDDGAAYRADVAARVADAGFDGFTYYEILSANIGTEKDEAMITPSIFGFVFVTPTDITLTGAGDDEVKWGNKDEVLLWGRGQGNDEVDVDRFFGSPEFTYEISNTVRMIGVNRDDVTIGKGDGPVTNDIVFTIIDTGETLTFRNMLLADNLAAGGIQFEDVFLELEELEPQLTALAQTGTDADDILYQRGGGVLDGRAGNDILRGGPEATIYVFGRGYGSDEIYDSRTFGPSNTVLFGPDISLEDLTFERPQFGNQADLIVRINGTDDVLRISNQYTNDLFVVDRFAFQDETGEVASAITGDEILELFLDDDAGDNRLVGSGKDETFGINSPGNDTFTGLRGDDVYIFNADSGSDIVIEGLRDRFDPERTVQFYRDLYIGNGIGDLVEIDFAFADLTVSRTATRLTFLDEASGAQLVVDNTKGQVELYTFAGDSYVYTLPEVMARIDAAVIGVEGSENDDIIEGDDGGNEISGGDGNDQIFGFGGDDILRGDAGNDILYAGDGSGTPQALRGNNTLEGGTGDDILFGGWGNDLLRGGDGNDTIEGDFGDDTFDGGLGDDTIIDRDGDAVYLYNLGDGNDLYLTSDDRFDETEFQLGAGITREDVSFRIVNTDISGLTTLNTFSSAVWALEMTLPDGATVTWAAGRSASNLAGIDRLVFAETGATITFNSIIEDLFLPSDEDQIFVDRSGSDVFAPGGGDDLLVFERGGTDTVSLGLDDGQNTVLGFLERVAFEGGVDPDTTTFERSGGRFEELLITLEDGTSLALPNLYSQGQNNTTGTLTQFLFLQELRFADGTVITGQNLLDADLISTAGDDIVTGSNFNEDIVQSAGDDILRGAGGSDRYFFGAGAGRDTIVELRDGPDLSPDDFESNFYDLSLFREVDTLTFAAGITLADLTLTRTGDTLDDLRIDLAGTDDSILITDQLRPDPNWGIIRGVEEADLERWRALDERYTTFNGPPGGGDDPDDPVRPFPDDPFDPDGPFDPDDPFVTIDPEDRPRSWGDDPVAAAGIECFILDGVTYTRAEFAALITAADNTGDNLISTGNDGGTLDGGAGDDMLEGGTGNDTYVFDAGYGSDVARDAGGTDEIAFGDDLPRGAMTITRTGPDLNDLLIEIAGVARTALYVEGQFAGDGREIEVFTFADGGTLTAEEIRQSLLTRSISNGDDVITGFEGDDIIVARKGDDVIEVRGGTDIVDGGTGFDTVVLRGPRDNYIVENEDGRIVVTDLTGRDGVNRLYNVERLVFADDGAGGAETTVALVENQLPTAGPVTLTLAEDGRLIIFDSDILSGASDPDGATLELISFGDASSGTLVADGKGRYAFTPDADATDDVTFSYTVRDAAGAEASGTLTVDITPVNDAPVVAAALSPQSSPEDTALAITLPADAFLDIDGDALVFSVTLERGEPLPEWLSFDAPSRSFTGLPPANFNGTLALVVTASDGFVSVAQPFALTISAVNDAPTLVAAGVPDVEFPGDRTIEFGIPGGTFADVDEDPLSFTATLSNGDPLPAWLVFQGSGQSFTGSPPEGFAGVLSIRVTATDGSESIFDDFDLTIVGVNEAPVVGTILASINGVEDTALDVTLPTDLFVDPDGDTLTISASLADGAPLPAWLVFDADAGKLTGTPPANFNGSFDITLTASDGEASASQTTSLTITAVNDAPVVANSLADIMVTEGTVFNILLPQNAFGDIDGDTLSYTATLADGTALPDWLEFDGSSFTATQPENLNGDFAISVTASDGTLSVSDTFNLSIAAVNDAPEAGDDSGFETTGTDPLTILASTLLANDADVDGDPIAIVDVATTGGGSVSLVDGEITYRAAAGFTGVDTFTYTLSDGDLTDTATVSVTVEADTAADPYADYLQGTEGSDFYFGPFFGNRDYFGAGGNDLIFGSFLARGDKLAGGDGNDRVFGLGGNDLVEGNAGNDRVDGGFGNDTVSGGTGDDLLFGGGGRDTFVFNDNTDRDVIRDFQSIDRIVIDVAGFDSFADVEAAMTQFGRSTIINLGDGDSIQINGWRPWALDDDMFSFV